MRSDVIFVSVASLLLMSTSVDAATFNFRVTKKGSGWECANQSKPDTARDGLTINVLIDGTPAPAKVELTAKYVEGGAETAVAVSQAAANRWQLAAKTAKLDADSPLVLEGTIDGVAVKCAAKVAFVTQTTTGASTLPTATRFTRLDALGDRWLQSDAGRAAATELIDRIYAEHDIARDKIVLLRHLPSGAPAFPFPSSVSEHQVMQLAVVVNMRDLASVEAAFGACERALRERIKGDFGVFAAKAQGVEELEPDFALKPVGALFQCGPETMSYSLTVSTTGDTENPVPSPARLDVRPVYHVGATALLGFDMTKRATFGAKSGVVTESLDRIGPTFYAGATWYPLGVDYGRMRWWNYVVNPFAAVSLENVKENFVVGNAFTVTGGVSIAVAAAFHRVEELDGLAVGVEFTGEGNVPTVKRWSKRGRGLFVGMAVDTNVFTALKRTGAPAAGGAGAK